MLINRILLATTAITAFGSTLHAQEISYQQLSQLMTVTGGSEQASFAFGPEWSEEFGLSVTGRLGTMLGEDLALGFVAEAGENITEGIVNLGFSLPHNTNVILSWGQLRQNLVVGDTGEREWVRQDEYGLAINHEDVAVSAYYLETGSTDNFIGGRTYGAEVEASTALAENVIISGGVGYQYVDWDDEALADQEALTGSLGFAVAVSDGFRINGFADYNMSEAQAGIGASWVIGSGTLDLDYTYVRMDQTSRLPDDHRVGLTLSVPIGGGGIVGASRNEVSRGMVGRSMPVTTGASGLLMEVMRRPQYLPEVVLVAAGNCSLDFVVHNSGNYESTFDHSYFYIYVTSPSGLLPTDYDVTISFNGDVALQFLSASTHQGITYYEFSGGHNGTPVEGETYSGTIGCQSFSITPVDDS